MTVITDGVFGSRAVRSVGIAIEDDPDPMVHQQLARLLFLRDQVGVRGCRVLEFGCGSGLNCDFLKEQCGARNVVGLDVSDAAVSLARHRYPHLTFVQSDGCDLLSEISPGEWDRVIACEVLEHVPDMRAFLFNIRRHLTADGIAFITTPNRDVFSLGCEPSPVNREHIKELSTEEFRGLLDEHFSHVEIWGQRFKRAELLEAWKDDVRRKILQVASGTRWKERLPVRKRLMRLQLIKRAYRIPILRRSWTFLRWRVLSSISTRRALRTRPYSFADFEFDRDTSVALWTCAVVSI